jgi:hypothetical protein
MAQSGSAPGLGPGGPRFESLYSDQFNRLMSNDVINIIDYVPVAQLDRAPAF